MDEAPSRLICQGVTGSEQAYILSGLIREVRRPFYVITPSRKVGERFVDDLLFFSGLAPSDVAYFPPYNILPFKSLSYHTETAAARISLLYKMIVGQAPRIIVTPVDTLLQRLIPRDEISGYAELVMEGEEIDRDSLIAKLIEGGYVQTALVEEPGDFCVRGGILDLFSPAYSEPVRIELYGDVVESLRFFSPLSQRKRERVQEIEILPAREAILRKSYLDDLLSQVRLQASRLGMPVTKVRGIVERIKTEGVFPGIESLIPLLYKALNSFFDYASPKGVFVLIDPDEMEKEAQSCEEKGAANYESAKGDKRLCVEPERLYLTWEAVKKDLFQRKLLSFTLFSEQPDRVKEAGVELVTVPVEENAALIQKLKVNRTRDTVLLPLVEWINEKMSKKAAVLIVCSTNSQMERLFSLLQPYGIEPLVAKGFSDACEKRGKTVICPGNISSGFVWIEEGVALISEDEIFAAKYRTRKTPGKRAADQFLQLGELSEGDIVVHEDHGLGKYVGLVKLSLSGVTNDYLLILYKDDDKLYLPVDRMDVIRKYIGMDGFTPVLDKMGGKTWDRLKDKAKKSVEIIAGELLKLYAERKAVHGHAFGITDSYFRDFEASFQYEETPDQIRAIEDVMHDMESPSPMDRLICGDVGYGKTEVALRAAFKAINEGKQVAVLVPTTVLAEQHYRTFQERFQKYPVKIERLSRFKTTAEQRAIAGELKEGKIDIVIGTHRLLQKDVDFKDLGLIVIDEEQRFGVKHKEALKRMRATVDVLALTATPIPRTLHLSLMGTRDISVISTPPEDRQAIISYISEFDEVVIAEAVRKELDRKGQIFFVHNNINTIYDIEEHLNKIVPEARTSVVHGRMDEKELEKSMFRFINREVDMLVCTTIIESGIDIPSANTMFINRADRFGLAQMYQLRGRIGRCGEQAYAYLFIPSDSPLGKDAKKRLKVLMEHSDLGSGFQIAMSDLQIRGGGTVLGASQSGHIAAIGYDMFLQLMENAVADLKGEPILEKLDPEINVSLSCYIPEGYVPEIDQRLHIYRRLSRMTELKEITDIKDELVDRYGPLPEEAGNMLLKIMLKVLAVKAGVKKIDLSGVSLILYFSALHQKNPHGMIDLISRHPKKYRFSPDQVLTVTLSGTHVSTMLGQAKNILKEIAQHVNP
jgi:transcription-repair coupling factor (superfamily II helicase)